MKGTDGPGGVRIVWSGTRRNFQSFFFQNTATTTTKKNIKAKDTTRSTQSTCFQAEFVVWSGARRDLVIFPEQQQQQQQKSNIRVK